MSRFGTALDPDRSRTGGLWGRSTFRTSLRHEFKSMVLAENGGIGVPLIHRKMSRTRERCPCWDPVQGSAANCAICRGEGFLWTESVVRGYFTQNFSRSMTGTRQAADLLPEGRFDRTKSLIYLPFDIDVLVGDMLFRFRGNPGLDPYYLQERSEKWRIASCEDKREERGELAFFICACERIET